MVRDFEQTFLYLTSSHHFMSSMMFYKSKFNQRCPNNNECIAPFGVSVGGGRGLAVEGSNNLPKGINV